MPILDVLQQLADGEPVVDLAKLDHTTDPLPADVHVEPELPIELPPVDPEPRPEPLPAAPEGAQLALTPRNYISMLFSARDRAHQLHLRTKSFSKHMALGELYERLIELADEIAEVVQGVYGVMEPVMGNVQSMTSHGETVDEEIRLFIEALAHECSLGHAAFGQADTFIHNLVDEVQALVFRTKYKLENLA